VVAAPAVGEGPVAGVSEGVNPLGKRVEVGTGAGDDVIVGAFGGVKVGRSVGAGVATCAPLPPQDAS
jgi:hypothetical protein